jgi:hypothetical protein
MDLLPYYLASPAKNWWPKIPCRHVAVFTSILQAAVAQIQPLDRNEHLPFDQNKMMRGHSL